MRFVGIPVSSMERTSLRRWSISNFVAILEKLDNTEILADFWDFLDFWTFWTFQTQKSAG
jgi:hypothetical protein